MPELAGSHGDSSTARQAAAERVGRYHRTELRSLLERVRDGFERLDGGEIDEFELDDLIHHYKRAAKGLWVFCNTARVEQVDHAISAMEERGEIGGTGGTTPLRGRG